MVEMMEEIWCADDGSALSFEATDGMRWMMMDRSGQLERRARLGAHGGHAQVDGTRGQPLWLQCQGATSGWGLPPHNGTGQCSQL